MTAIMRSQPAAHDARQLIGAGAFALALITIIPAIAANLIGLAIAPLVILIVVRPALPRPIYICVAILCMTIPADWTIAVPWAVLLPLALSSIETMPRRWIERIVMTGGALHGLAGLAVISPELGRAAGLLSHPNILAGLLSPLLVMAIARRRWWIAACIATGLAATASRGGIAGAGVGMLVLIAPRLWSWSRNHRTLAIAAGSGAAIAGMAIGIYFLTLRSGGLGVRWEMWYVAAKAFVESGGRGVGSGGYAAAFAAARPGASWPPGPHSLVFHVLYVALYGAQNFLPSHPHNIPLHIAAEGGIVGLVALAMLSVWAWKNAQSDDRALMVAVAVAGLVDCAVLFPLVFFVVLVVVAQNGTISDRMRLTG